MEQKDTSFLGQPKQLFSLFFTETWERFSYYGMRAILLYFMYYQVTQGGLGLPLATAQSIMSIYGALVYFSGVFGGFIADRMTGSRKAVFYGGVLIMLGHVVLSIPFFAAGGLFFAMFLIIIGTGLLKPNISTMVGELYPENDPRRDAGFSIFVFGVNLGSFTAPYIVGLAPKYFSFHTGFSIAGVGMLIGLIVFYVTGKRDGNPIDLVPRDPLKESEIKPLIRRVVLTFVTFVATLLIMAAFKMLNITNIINMLSLVIIAVTFSYFVVILSSKKITKIERSRVFAYIPLFIASVFFWSIEEQGSVVLATFAASRVDYPSWFSPSWFQSLNPMFIMLYTPLFVWLWHKLGKRQPSTTVKFALGLIFAGASFLVMSLPGLLYGINVKASPLWLVLSWGLVMLGEMLVSPIGLSVTTKLAPKAFGSQMMSVWFLSSAVAQAMNAQIVRYFTIKTEVSYFLTIGIFTILLSIPLFFLSKTLNKLMQGVN